MKRYVYNCLHRGQQITKEVCAKNIKEASEKLGISTYMVTSYCGKTKIDEPFEGVIAYFDSGDLWTVRPDLIRVKMPLEELIKIIDVRVDEKWNKFKTEVGFQ